MICVCRQLRLSAKLNSCQAATRVQLPLSVFTACTGSSSTHSWGAREHGKAMRQLGRILCAANTCPEIARSWVAPHVKQWIRRSAVGNSYTSDKYLFFEVFLDMHCQSHWPSRSGAGRDLAARCHGGEAAVRASTRRTRHPRCDPHTLQRHRGTEYIQFGKFNVRFSRLSCLFVSSI